MRRSRTPAVGFFNSLCPSESMASNPKPSVPVVTVFHILTSTAHKASIDTIKSADQEEGNYVAISKIDWDKPQSEENIYGKVTGVNNAADDLNEIMIDLQAENDQLKQQLQEAQQTIAQLQANNPNAGRKAVTATGTDSLPSSNESHGERIIVPRVMVTAKTVSTGSDTSDLKENPKENSKEKHSISIGTDD
jgi:hypothetical protein